METSWIEIISLIPAERGAAIKVLELCGKIKLPKIAGSKVYLRVYGNAGYKTDLSIHIHWCSQSRPEGKSSFAIELSRALGEYGEVSHRLWVERADCSAIEQIAV